MANEKHPLEILVRDPLSRVTRAERRTLLGVSAIGLVIARSGLVPSRISALGIEFDRADQSALLGMLAAVVTYFLIAFLVYAFSDFVAWRLAFRSAAVRMSQAYRKRSEADIADEQELLDDLSGRWSQRASFLAIVTRGMFEFVVPIVIGIVAVYALTTSRPATGAADSRSRETSVGSVAPSVTVTGDNPGAAAQGTPKPSR